MNSARKLPPNDFMLCKEYYLREKEMNYEQYLTNKSKWQGAPFYANRKIEKDQIPKVKKQFVKFSQRTYLNTDNDFSKFCKNKARLKILKNYK